MNGGLTRSSLLKLAGAMAAAIGADALGRRSLGEGDALAADAVACVLAPEQTEGPYYIANERVRRNITEGRPGVPLTLHLAVVNARTCRPIRGAAVDIWHCDAEGIYSGFGAGRTSRTFMRGIQWTNADGIATFKTVYPGWYSGRTVHIHIKVHVRGNVVHTGQLYFPDAGPTRPTSERPTRAGPTGRCAMRPTSSSATAADARCCACDETARATSERSEWEFTGS
jgi:protocatechuate 3,4-dioxygenase beta subunit